MKFVPLMREHLKQIANIEIEAFDTPWTEQMFLPELESSDAFYLVGEQSGEVICYGGFHKVLDEGHITNIAVKNCYRGKGIGKHLMNLLIELAAAVGVRAVTLEVKTTNVTAVNMYSQLGFKIEGIRKRYYNNKDDAYVMWLYLGG